MVKANIFQHSIMEAITNRRSTVIFGDAGISDNNMQLLLEAASLAPSAYNEQPWQYLYAMRGTPIFDTILSTLAIPNQEWAKHAAVLVVSLSRKYLARNGEPNFHHLYDTGAANAFMMLQAESLGIGSHTMGGFNREMLRKSFSIPDDIEIASVIAFGYRSSDMKNRPENLVLREQMPRKRKASAEMIFGS